MAVLSKAMWGKMGVRAEQNVRRGSAVFNRGGRRVLLSALLLAPMLAACGSIKSNVSDIAGKVAHPELQTPKSCAGWEKIDMKNKTRYLLMQKDAKLLMSIDSHNLRGQNLGCWN